MNKRIHGVLSLLWLGIANLIAVVVLGIVSPWLALILVALLILASWIIIRQFCTKCCCAQECRHLFPGLVARQMGMRESGPYTKKEIAWVVVMALLAGVFPQYWLWQHRIWFAVYWILASLALLEILIFVCDRCGNQFCPNNTRQGKKVMPG